MNFDYGTVHRDGLELDSHYLFSLQMFEYPVEHTVLGPAVHLSSELESVGIDQVREAFRSDDGASDTVIVRWYDGTESYDLSRLDTAPVDPTLGTINGRIDQAYVSTAMDGPAESTFSAQDVND